MMLWLHAGAPLAPHDVLRTWTWDPLVLAGLCAAAALYARGALRAPRSGRWIRIAFWTGWVALSLALLSPLHAASEILFSAHMAQHTILMTIAAPLLIVGRPALTSLWAFDTAVRKTITRRTMPVLHAVSNVPAGLAFLLHAATIWLWHAPALYDLVLLSGFMHAIQHASFLGSALLFWNAILAPGRRATGLGKGIVYVFATALHTALLGALITLAPTVWYRGYFALPPGWSITPLQDQQIAGLIMWVPAGLLYTIAGIALVAAWLREAERRNTRRALVAVTPLAILILLVTGCERLSRRQAMDDKAAATATGGNPRLGRDAVEQLGCGGCHTIRGVRGANGEVGPPLNGLVRRMYIGGVLPNTPDNLARWIQDPRAVDSLTAMPNLGVTPKLSRDIAAFLYTLR